MTDTTSILESAKREVVRAESIANNRVVPLRHDMTAGQRAVTAIECLISAVYQLETVANEDVISRAMEEAIDSAETRLSLLRTKVHIRRNLVHLTSERGRAP